jgi:hypothetical protein
MAQCKCDEGSACVNRCVRLTACGLAGMLRGSAAKRYHSLFSSCTADRCAARSQANIVMTVFRGWDLGTSCGSPQPGCQRFLLLMLQS